MNIQIPQPSRREFLHFLKRGALSLPFLPLLSLPQGQAQAQRKSLHFHPIQPSLQDRLVLSRDFQSYVIASWGDTINSKGDTFGFNNDYTAFLPLYNENDALLWVNHESPNRLFINGLEPGQKPNRAQVQKEQYAVGGSIIRIRREHREAPWQMVQDDRYNRRLTAQTEIPFVSERPILGKMTAIGTLANCSGGVTPWQTILTCEENYDEFYNEADYQSGARKLRDPKSYFGWEEHFAYPPEHYGWVVEVNPRTGRAQKLTALGRFAHEGAAIVTARNGRAVVYMGDDAYDQCIYKFVAKNKNSLKEGELFVADLERGRWCSLDIKKQKSLQKHFRDQTEVLIRAREAARWVGGTPLDRPEDIEVDPLTGAIYVCLTNNPKKGNDFGSILKIEEDEGDFLSKEFDAQTFLAGGPQTGFACPDNLSFDGLGRLWMTNDISNSWIGKKQYKSFGNNGLYHIPLQGPQAGKVLQLASAPKDAEFTGISFSKDNGTMFMSVQHPGSSSETLNACTSDWPEGKGAIPKPSVIAIHPRHKLSSTPHIFI